MRYLGIKNDGNYAALISESVAFTDVVPMDGNYSVESHNVTGPINFVIGGFIPGGKAVYRLIANGVNLPTFTGFKESSDSTGYDNRNTIANTIEFGFDGVDYWYRVKQEKGALAARVFTFNTPGAISLNIPPNCTTISIAGFGGGGGGASGRKSAVGAAAFGGGGGGGAGWTERRYSLDELGLTAGSLLTGVVGAGGNGGAAVTANSTNGNAGTTGGVTSLRIGAAGSFIFSAASGDRAPSASTTSGAGGGASSGDIVGTSGSASSITATPSSGSSSWKASGGGGAGGGIDATNNPRAGGQRGPGNQGSGNVSTPPAAAPSTTANGTNGPDGGESLDGKITPGNGGGGGGASSAVGFNGGNGGAGGPGAGGGGGGAARDGAGSSGAGGAGGSGALQIIFS